MRCLYIILLSLSLWACEAPLSGDREIVLLENSDAKSPTQADLLSPAYKEILSQLEDLGKYTFPPDAFKACESEDLFDFSVVEQLATDSEDIKRALSNMDEGEMFEFLNEITREDSHSVRLKLQEVLEPHHANNAVELYIFWLGHKQGYPNVGRFLAEELLLCRSGVKQDPERAFKLLQRSTDAGDSFGMKLAGRLLYEGFGVAKDEEKGQALQDAAFADFVDALYIHRDFQNDLIDHPGSAKARPGDLTGTWDVFLIFDPDQPPSQTTLKISNVKEDGSFDGSFYGTAFETAMFRQDGDDVVIAFVTSDGAGAYHGAGRLNSRGDLAGQTLSMGRGFLMPWSARKVQ